MERERDDHGGIKLGLAPIAEPDARLIILGSLPGDASLAAARYYAHPTNQFWRLVGAAIGSDLVAMHYDARLAALRQARIGLWDVIGSARRRGSLDQAIRSPAPNALAQWLGRFPDLRAIAFNGQAATRAGRAALSGATDAAMIDLPSSSAAHTLAFAAKAERWSEIAGFLDESVLAPHAPTAKIGR